MAGKDERGWARGLGAGLEMASGMGLGAAVGYWWDKHHGSSNWGVLIGLLVGGVAGTYLLVKEVMRINRN